MYQFYHFFIWNLASNNLYFIQHYRNSIKILQKQIYQKQLITIANKIYRQQSFNGKKTSSPLQALSILSSLSSITLNLIKKMLQQQQMIILLLSLISTIAFSAQILQTFDSQLSTSDVNSYRVMVARRNIQMVQQHNSDPKQTSTMKAYPQLIGLTLQQITQLYYSKTPLQNPQVVATAIQHAQQQSLKLSPTTTKNSLYYDLRTYISTPVYSQGFCNNPYAYATSDHFDMLNLRNYPSKNIPTLSYQHLTDCSSSSSIVTNKYYANSGCAGGQLNNSFYFIQQKGIYALFAYNVSPFSVNRGFNQTCRSINPGSSQGIVYKIAKYIKLDPLDPNQRAAALVNKYSIPSLIAAGNNPFNFYAGGIISDCDNDTKLNHAVIIVGFSFNTSSGNYWIIKNTRGTGWGEQGYARIAMGTSCGLLYQGYVGTT